MNLVTIFYHVDNFCKDFDDYLKVKTIGSVSKSGRKPGLLMSETMTIMIMFHHSKMRTFKDFYNYYVKQFLREEFPGLVSYNRFVELMQKAFIHLYFFINCCCLGKVTGISFIDSTILKVCHNLRISSHKVFKGFAARGKTSTGWFYGFKLHLVINEYGEILSFMITPGNTADQNENVMNKLTKGLHGKLFGDRGYLSSKIFKTLFQKGIQLFTRVRKNMKNAWMKPEDKALLRKRGVIESVNNKLKTSCQIEHTRHRSMINFLANIVTGLIAYSFLDKKPSIRRYNPAQISCV